MPLLNIQTNRETDAAQRAELIKTASITVAEVLGKPERYVMVSFQQTPDMLFGGDDAPLAYLELKSIGLPGERTTDISAALCALMDGQLGIPKERVYIEFADAARSMWGWNGGTF